MTKSRFLKLDRKLSQLSFYNIIYQYRMKEIGFIETRRWSDTMIIDPITG